MKNTNKKRAIMPKSGGVAKVRAKLKRQNLKRSKKLGKIVSSVTKYDLEAALNKIYDLHGMLKPYVTIPKESNITVQQLGGKPLDWRYVAQVTLIAILILGLFLHIKGVI